MEIQGTKHRQSVTDYAQGCKCCHRLFYFSRDSHGKIVICPHCKTRH